jgi:hypothetical protein
VKGGSSWTTNYYKKDRVSLKETAIIKIIFYKLKESRHFFFALSIIYSNLGAIDYLYFSE